MHRHNSAADITRFVRQKPKYGTGNLLGRTETAHRKILLHRLKLFGGKRANGLGKYGTRADGVDTNAYRSHFTCETDGQTFDCSFAGGINRKPIPPEPGAL